MIKFKMTNAQYDLLNRIVKYVLPATGAAYFSLAQIWGFGYAEQIVGTIACVGTFLAVILAVSKHNYEGLEATPPELGDPLTVDMHYKGVSEVDSGFVDGESPDLDYEEK